ncbi:hypothetical protein Airi02_021420 [Actinoallomurus iriomotensis]|uniref:Uncharacterized protein n=1 Tax=Actinoallomurus iriomotensis TaxID=478107 RepID=A0A9W6RYX9_9ACTN|nr:hypothetical protein Airi02_021420 [Actinoallomurus iriomotensis]
MVQSNHPDVGLRPEPDGDHESAPELPFGQSHLGGVPSHRSTWRRVHDRRHRTHPFVDAALPRPRPDQRHRAREPRLRRPAQSPDLDGRPGQRHLVGRHPEQPGHGAWSQPHSDQRSALGE